MVLEDVLIIFAQSKKENEVKKTRIIIILAAAAFLLALAGCTKTGSDEVVYRIEVVDNGSEEYNGSPTSDAKKVYAGIDKEIASFKSSYAKTWKESAPDGDFSLTDAAAEKRYGEALVALRDIEASAIKQIKALPSGRDNFKFRLKLVLTSVTAEMGETVLKSDTVSIICP